MRETLESLETKFKSMFCSRGHLYAFEDSSLNSSQQSSHNNLERQSNESVDEHSCPSDCSSCFELGKKERAEILVGGLFGTSSVPVPTKQVYFIDPNDSNYEKYHA